MLPRQEEGARTESFHYFGFKLSRGEIQPKTTIFCYDEYVKTFQYGRASLFEEPGREIRHHRAKRCISLA